MDSYTADDIFTYNQVLDFIERDRLDIESEKEIWNGSVVSALTEALYVIK
jgi:hypothetical protein